MTLITHSSNAPFVYTLHWIHFSMTHNWLLGSPQLIFLKSFWSFHLWIYIFLIVCPTSRRICWYEEHLINFNTDKTSLNLMWYHWIHIAKDAKTLVVNIWSSWTRLLLRNGLFVERLSAFYWSIFIINNTGCL